MLRSWHSEDYKRGERPDLAHLPVRLAYATQPHGAPAWPPRACPPPDAVLTRAEQLGSPPLAWARFLAVRPDLLADWTDLYWTTVHGEPLGRRLGQLVRVYLSLLLGCPAWAPPDSAAVREAGLTPADVAALARGDTAWLTPREQAALAYAREVVADTDVPDDVFAQVAAALSEAEIVALGFAVAVQNGALRVFRSMQDAGVGLSEDAEAGSVVP
ncbi:MAG TPA: carboxymuconolactone decarboxylase family protein [Chloroflexota bacterium]|nr:carboxymuconolactone decarboxylase family protein [Chloroflexota bacterium]